MSQKLRPPPAMPRIPSKAVPPFVILIFCGLSCTNNPYRAEFDDQKVFYKDYTEPTKTLDPAVGSTTTDHEVTGKIFDTLLEYHYLKRPFVLIPALASEVPAAEQLADGHVRYRFRLRDDLVFQSDPCFAKRSALGQNTRAITAADFAFALMRIADPQVDSPVGEQFSSILGFRDFTQKLMARRSRDAEFAKRPPHEQYAGVGGIEGVRAASPTQLDLELSVPYPQILYWFAISNTAPVPWEAVVDYDGKDGRPRLADHPVGSGPFRLEQYDRQSRIVLVKDENWYGARHPEWKAPGATYPSEGAPGDREAGLLDPKAVGRTLPFIERIELRLDKENIPAFNKFLQGYYDQSAIYPESFDRIVQGGSLSAEMAQKGMRLAKTVMPDLYYVGFNMEDKTVGGGSDRSRRLRQAMSLVVDSREFTRLFLNGRGIPAQSPLPPGIFGYDPAYKNPFRTVDEGRARSLLVEAGYPDGIDPATGRPLHLTFDTGDTSTRGRLYYQFLVDSWRRIGIDVEIAATNYNKFQDKVRQGAYQIYWWGWVGDYPDPENFLFLLWSEMARSKQGGLNTANYANPLYDDLFQRMKTRANDEERLAIIRKMIVILEQDCPWIEIFHRESYLLYHDWLSNVKPAGLSIPTLKYLDIAKVERASYRKVENEPVLWPVYVLLGILALVIGPGIRTFFRERQ